MEERCGVDDAAFTLQHSESIRLSPGSVIEDIAHNEFRC